MQVTIYHNGKCGTARGTLERIRARGVEPTIIEYLKTPLTRDELAALIARMGVAVRDVVRSKEPLYAELNLADADDAALLDAMAAHPILMNRPIVVTDKGAKLCRPAEIVDTLL
jgi:arsenate reductase